jgi:DNA-binding CsgD family transcriptional regulator
MASLISVTGEDVARDIQLVEMLNSLVHHLHHAMLRVANLAPLSPSAMLLSNREYDIFHWMSRGKTNWEIATILEISERTVKFHVANIIRKLSANNRTHAIVLGLQQGLQAPIAANE